MRRETPVIRTPPSHVRHTTSQFDFCRSESPQASGQPQSQTKKVHVGAVVGPTIAGVACIAIVIATIFIYRRRRQRKRARSDNSKLDPNDVYYYNELSNSAPIGNNVETNRDIPHGGAQGPVIEPYMLTAPNPGILMEKLNNSIPLYTSQSAPGSSVPESTSMGRTTTEGSSDGGTTHPSAIPGLLQRLNEAIAQLPSSGTTAHSEADLPPGYYEGRLIMQRVLLEIVDLTIISRTCNYPAV